MHDPTNDPSGEEVHVDHGGWLSGPSATEQVRAVELDSGDVILMEDRKVIVEAVRPHGAGWVVTWHAGTSSGVFSLPGGERVTRVSAYLTDEGGA
jgi:hypothetical protein